METSIDSTYLFRVYFFFSCFPFSLFVSLNSLGPYFRNNNYFFWNNNIVGLEIVNGL